MEAFFNDIETQIRNKLSIATKQINIAVAWFTNERLFESIIQKLKENVAVSLIVIYDDINCGILGVDFQKFISNGGKLYFSSKNNTMHNKFCIIDNKLLINGSYNWTYRQWCILDRHCRLLEFGDRLFEPVEVIRNAGLADLLEIGADGKRRLVPDDQSIETAGRLLERSQHAIEHFVTDGVHLRLEGNDADAGVDRRQRPQTDAVVLEQGVAALFRLGQGFAEQQFREQLATINRQLGTRHVALAAGRPIRQKL